MTTRSAADLDRDRRLDLLLDKQEIAELLARWCRGLDRGDEALLAATYHPDALDEHGRHTHDGATAPRAYIDRHRRAFRRHLHLVTNALIEVDGDRATAESSLIALLVPDATGAERVIVSSGRFLDRLERRDGEWRFAHRVWIREAVIDVAQFPHEAYAAFVADPPEPGLGHGMPYAGHRSPDDPSYAYLRTT